MNSIAKHLGVFNNIFHSNKISVQQVENKQKISEILQEQIKENPEIINWENTFFGKTTEQLREQLFEVKWKLIMFLNKNRAIDSLCGPSETFLLAKSLAHMEDLVEIGKELQILLLETLEKNSDEYLFTEEEKNLLKVYISEYPHINHDK